MAQLNNPKRDGNDPSSGGTGSSFSVNSFGLLISDPPGSRAFAEGIAAAEHALKAGEWVGVYLLDEAVQGVGEAALSRMGDQGMHLSACSHAARLFGVPLTSSAIFGGLSILGDLLANVSRFAHASRAGFFERAPAPRPRGSLRRVLMESAGDPRVSHKPSEAVRCGIGLGAWSQVEVHFCFIGESCRILAEEWAGFRGEELLERYVPMLKDWPNPIQALEPTTDLSAVTSRAHLAMRQHRELGTVENSHDLVLRL